MANAKLHIICGNCGCNDDFTFEVVKDGKDVSDTETKFEDAFYIWCENCGTLHDLEDNARKRP